MAPDLLWIGTSWKMTKTLAQSRAWVDTVCARPLPDGIRGFVLPSTTALAGVASAVPRGSGLLVGAQNAHWAPQGACTGEVSMDMVRDAGAVVVEVGHSERRTGFHENDDVVARKVRAAVDAGLVPLLCVGEPAAVRDAGDQVPFVVAQLRNALAPLDSSERREVLLAYEPVWAIGEGGRPAAPSEIEPVIAAICGEGSRLTGGQGLASVLYGGSVSPDNAVELLNVDRVGGLFVGRAAWSAEGFLGLLSLAAEVVTRPARTP